jgi:hypothetical protein
MEINRVPPAPPNLTAALSQLQGLRIGQLLQAVVIKQLGSDSVLLQLINTNTPSSGQPLQLTAQTPQPLVLGQQLQLEVSQLGERPILKVLNQTVTTESVRKEALLQALPRQTSMTPLLANLSWINQQQGTTLALPQAVQRLARELLEKLPSRDKLSTAEGVKQALKESGLFLESSLRQAAQKGAPPEGGNDLKGLLLQLLNTVQKEQAQTAATTPQPSMRPPLPATPLSPQPPPPAIPGGRPQPQKEAQATLATLTTTLALLQELGNQTEASLARTQLHQLASLPTPEQNPLTWSFELPIRNQERVDLFQFIIEEHKGGRDENEQQQRRWGLTLAFELEGLGPMHTRLQLENGKVGATFWADSLDTTTLIHQNLAELAQRFEQAGLERGELRCFQGQPPEAARTTLPPIVLDVKA